MSPYSPLFAMCPPFRPQTFAALQLIAIIGLSLAAVSCGTSREGASRVSDTVVADDSPTGGADSGHADVASNQPEDVETSGDSRNGSSDKTEHNEVVDTNGKTDAEACDSDHRKVGWTARLETKQHGVEGRAKIIDNCTIELQNFHYDGQGPDAYIYGAKNRNWADGFPLSDKLTEAYTGETLSLTLPDGRTLDVLDGISVWCVEFSVDFGSGLFNPPGDE